MAEAPSAAANQVREVSKNIIPHLRGLSPDIAGGVLGELVGLYIAGHRPDTREAVLEAFVVMVRSVAAIVDEQGHWGPKP